MDWKAVAIILSLAALAVAAPLQDGSICASECSPAFNQKFKYLTKKTYHYTYESSVSMRHEGVSDETPGIKHTFGVEFHVQAPCEILLKVTNAKLADVKPDPKVPTFKKSLEEKTLLFAYHDGLITEVCPDPKDLPWVVNLKRAVLSSFQNTIDNHLETTVREVDVSGQCDTHYTIKDDSPKNTVIYKTKDLASCTHRLGNNSRIQADSYVSYSNVQSLPLTNSTHKCKQTIKDGILTESICEETHVLELLNKGDKGATARTYTKLAYVKTVNGVAKSIKKVVKSDLLYDHHSDYKEAADVAGATKILREICEYTKDEVNSVVPALFTKLVYKVRYLSASDINGLLKATEGKAICPTTKAKDALLSSLAMAGTDGAIQVIAQQLAGGKVTPLREKLWYTTFALVRDPSSASIEATIPLIDVPKPKRIALLAVSSLAHTFCRVHTDCENDKSIQKLIDKIAKHLGNNCKSNSDDQEDTVIAALKAFGNIGRGGNHVDTLIDCAQDTSLHNHVRVAAIEAFRRFPCNSATTGRLFSILENIDDDTEIRIDAYLATARCPTYNAVEAITKLLEREHINQVGNFIWSHIKNLKETESPEKASLKKIANKIHLQNKFRRNPNKYSYNLEWSKHSDKYNLGATVDNNVVFSTKSFLPRSITSNVTVNLFGRSINLFEAELRVENFDFLLEKLFGPEGYYKTHSSDEIRADRREKYYKIGQKLEESATRSKRESFPLIKQSQSGPLDKPRPVDKPEASLSFKVFGNEIRWYNFHNFYEVRDEGTYNFDEILNKLAKHKELDILRNVLFLDTTYAIPTATGIALKLKLNGTATFGLKLTSHFDIRQIFISPRSADIDTFIQPSVAAELSTSFVIDAGSYTTGLKKVSNVHSTTALHAKVDLKESNSLAVDINLPKEEQEIFHYRGNVYLVTGESQRPLKLINNDQYNLNACTKPFFGLEACGKAVFPKPFINPDRPWIFISGPLESQLTIKKFDPALKGYQFRSIWKREKDASGNIQKSHILFSYDTPGTKESHKYSFEVLLDRPGKEVKVELITPVTSAKLKGQITVTGNTKKVQLSLAVDGTQDINIQGEILVETKGNKITYKPSLKSTNGVISGVITRDVGRKITFDVQLKEDPERFKIKGFLQRDGERPLFSPGESSADLEINLPSLKAHLVGKRVLTVSGTDVTHTHEITLDHHVKALGWTKHTSTYKRNYQRSVGPDGKVTGKFLAEFTSTRIPKYNYRVKLDYAREPGHIGYTLDAHYGPNLDDNIHKLFITESISFKRPGPGKFDLDMVAKYIHPPSEINWDSTSTTRYDNHKLDHETKILSNGVNKLDVNLHYKKEIGKYGPNYDANLAVKYPGREVIISHERERYAEGKIKGKTHIQWEAGKYADIISKYNFQKEENVVHVEADIQVSLYNNPSPIRTYTLLVHKVPGKLDFKAEVKRPDNTYFAELHYDVSPDRSNINGVANIKLPSITGKLELKKQATQTIAGLDYKSPRRHIIGSYKAKGPYENRQVDAELKWDADNDATQKVVVQATIKRPKGKRAGEIKGSIAGPTKSLKGTVTYDLPEKIFNGKHVVTADIEFAPRKKATFSAEVFIDKSVLGKRTSTGKILFNSPSYPNVKINYNTSFHDDGIYRRLKIQGVIDGANLKTESFNFYQKSGDGSIRSSIDGVRNGEDYGFSISYRVPKFTFEELAFGAGIGITLPTTGTNYAAVVDYNRKFSPDDVRFDTHTYFRWADDREVGFDAEYYRLFHRENDILNDIEIKGKLKTITPFEHHRKQYVSLHYKLGLPTPKNKWVATLNGEAQAQWAHKKVSLKHSGTSTEQGSGNYKLVVLTPSSDKPIFEYTSEVKATEKGDKKNFKTDTVITWVRDGTTKTFSSNGDITVSTPNIDYIKADIKYKIPSEIYPSVKIVFEGKKKGDLFTGKTQVDWEDGKTLTAEGQLKIGKGQNFELSLAINSKILEIDNWKLGFSKNTLSDTQRKYLLDVKGPASQYTYEVSATDKPNGKKIEGALEINKSPFLSFIIDSTTTQKDDYHKERIIDVKIISDAISLDIKTQRIWGPNKALASIQTCAEERCFKLEYLRDNHIDSSKNPKYEETDFEWHILASAKGLDGDDYSRTAGIFIRRQTKEYNINNSARIATWDEQKKYIGYTYVEKRISEQSGSSTSRDLQIKLPSRIVQFLSAKHYKYGQGTDINADLLLDAKREPKRKLTFTFSDKYNQATRTNIKKIALKHPDLPNELSLTATTKSKEGGGGFTRHTELSLSQDASKKVNFDFEVDIKPYLSGYNYSFVYNIRQLSWLNIDSSIIIQRARVPEGYSLHIGYRWKSTDNQYKTIQFEVDIDRIAKELEFKLVTPWRKLVLDGHWHALDSNPKSIDGIRADFSLSKDGKVVRKAAFDGSIRRPLFNFKYYADPEDRNRIFRLHGGLEDPTTFHLTATRLRGGKEYQEADFVTKLNSSRLLYVSLDWRPDLAKDIHNGLETRFQYLSSKLGEINNHLTTEFGESYKAKKAAIYSFVGKELKPAIQKSRENFAKLRAELKEDLQKKDTEGLKVVVSGLVGDFYNPDEIVDALEDVRDKFRAFLQARLDRIKDILSNLPEAFASFAATVTDKLYALPQRIVELLHRIHDRFHAIGEGIKRFIELLGDKLESIRKGEGFLGAIYLQLDDLASRISARISEYSEKYAGKSLWERFKDRLENYATNHPEAKEFIQGVIAAIESFRQNIRDIIEGFQTKLHKFHQHFFETFTDAYEKVTTNPQIKELVTEIRNFRLKLQEKYLHDDDDYWRNKLAEYRERIDHYLGKYDVYDFENGHFVTYIPLVLPIYSLRNIRKAFYVDFEDRRDNRYLAKYFIKRIIKKQDHLPPIDGHGLLIGDKHYVTFDGRFYEFEDKCSYLLAKDFVDGNFSVVVNYDESGDRQLRKSITVYADGHAVEIGRDQKVTLDKKAVTLPTEVGNLYIGKTGHKIYFEGKGLFVEYDHAHDFVLVDINGFYFGKVAGLLGKYNYEANDDFTGPTGLNFTLAEDFAHSWQTNPQCNHGHHHEVHKTASYGSKTFKLCTASLNQHVTFSDLRACFPVINPDPFLDICLHIDEHDHDDHDACNKIAAYVTLCQHLFVDVTLPDECDHSH